MSKKVRSEEQSGTDLTGEETARSVMEGSTPETIERLHPSEAKWLAALFAQMMKGRKRSDGPKESEVGKLAE